MRTRQVANGLERELGLPFVFELPRREQGVVEAHVAGNRPLFEAARDLGGKRYPFDPCRRGRSTVSGTSATRMCCFAREFDARRVLTLGQGTFARL